jgi:hypothetical protein
MKVKKTAKDELLCVQLFEAKPNQMFTEAQTANVRFLRYNKTVQCAECGKRSKFHWTSLIEFMAMSMGNHIFGLDKSGLVHAPMTPVCRDHLLAPAWPENS